MTTKVAIQMFVQTNDDEIDDSIPFFSLLNLISYVSNEMNIEWSDSQTSFVIVS